MSEEITLEELKKHDYIYWEVKIYTEVFKYINIINKTDDKKSTRYTILDSNAYTPKEIKPGHWWDTGNSNILMVEAINTEYILEYKFINEAEVFEYML